MKDGADFFIPKGDMWRYFEKADNFDRDWTNYDISHWYDWYWYEYHIEYSFSDFTVHLIYMHNGVLKGMMIPKKDATYHRIIFEMWLGDPHDDEEEDEEEDERAIPGYDIVLVSFLISVVSIVSAIKIKKSKKTKE